MPALERDVGDDYCWFRFESDDTDCDPFGSPSRHTGTLFKRDVADSKRWFVRSGSRTKLDNWRGAASATARAVSGDWRQQFRGAKRRGVEREEAVRSSVKDAIDSSRWILELEDDWDGQGATGYSETAWRRACDFLFRQAGFARQTLGRELPAPKILPGPDGSVDLHWKMSRFELLVNVPADPAKPATFYGDDYGDLCIRGNLNTSEEIAGLVVWLLT